MKRIKRIAIVSCCSDAWGGSEELWARGIPILQKEPVEITLIKEKIVTDNPHIKSLADNGVDLTELGRNALISDKLLNVIPWRIREKIPLLNNELINRPPFLKRFYHLLKTKKFDLVVIAQGINFDGLIYAKGCVETGIPYILIVQKAVDFYWPREDQRSFMRECYKQAVHVFFVSQHNKKLTEEQFATRLSNSSVVYNPIKIPATSIPYPDTSLFFKLACVGRLFILDKGQDLLLRILSKAVWRERPVLISIIGTGPDETGLRELSPFLGVKNVRFTGWVDDIESIWREHHALILPSRGEGLPLTLLEAMAAGRTAIVSTAGGNTELIEDGVTGFVGEPVERSFENAMEMAWERRSEWEEMGRSANHFIKDHVLRNPQDVLAHQIKQILYGN